jgi:hypothetical protein
MSVDGGADEAGSSSSQAAVEGSGAYGSQEWDTWEAWHCVRTLADYDSLLGVALELGPVVGGWGEPSRTHSDMQEQELCWAVAHCLRHDSFNASKHWHDSFQTWALKPGMIYDSLNLWLMCMRAG